MKISHAFAVFDQHFIQQTGLSQKTRKNYFCALNSFIKNIGDVPIELITLDTAVIWKTAMTNQGNSPSTMRCNLIKLRKVLEHFRDRGVNVADLSKIEMPKLIRKQPCYLEAPEVSLMIDAAGNERDKAIIALLFSTGCRISEVLNLNVLDVETDEPVVCGKGDKYRTVFIDARARKYLNEYLATRKDSYKPLFMSRQHSRLGVSMVEKMVHKCSMEAGIDKNVTPHTFRHSTITDYIRNGAPMAIVQQIAGHSNIQTTIDIYTHVQVSDQRSAFRNFHSSV